MSDKLHKFITKASVIHKNKYSYADSIYISSKTKITIVCQEHGIFAQTPNNHLKGKGCPKCGIINRKNCKTKNIIQFVNEAKEIHKDKYDYSKVIYKNLKTKVIIICPEHGLFSQTPKSHLKGCGCPKCGRIICGDKLSLNTNVFINEAKKIHKNKYDYSLVNYKNMNYKVKIICNLHGIFSCSPNHHLYMKSGCPVCKESKGEITIREYLINNNIKFIPQYKIPECKNKKPLPFDFYLPKYNTCIEFNGSQHYQVNSFFGESNFNLTQKNDKIKMEYCKNNSIPLIIVKYNEDVVKMLDLYFKT